MGEWSEVIQTGLQVGALIIVAWRMSVIDVRVWEIREATDEIMEWINDDD